MPRRAPAMRLASIDPDQIAREVTSHLSREYAQVTCALGGARTTVQVLPETQTPVYRRVRALAAYAAEGAPLRQGCTPEDELTWLTLLLHLKRPPIGEPYTILEAVMVGARARSDFDRALPLSASHLALLAGIDRDTLLSLAKGVPGAYRSEERGKPWRFPVSAALRDWMGARMGARRAQRVA